MTKGIFISSEILELSNISHTEMILLSIYKYYTEEGKLGCCTMTNESINEQFLHVNEKTFKKCKKHLKDLGYISTDGGIRVKYIGVSDNTKKSKNTKNGKKTVTKENNDDKHVKESTTCEEETDYEGQDSNCEEVQGDDNREKTNSNFDKVIENLHPTYKSKEHIKFLEDKYKDMLNNIDDDDFNVEFYTKQATTVLNNQFHIYYNAVVETKKDDADKYNDTTIEL